MKVIKNQPMLQQLNKNLAMNEMSNIAMVLQTPSIFVTWYDIDPDLSETIGGYKNIDDYIHPDSTLVFNKIEHLPMYGIDNLLSYAEFDDDIVAYGEENAQLSGVIYPNTVMPKPGSLFVLEGPAPEGINTHDIAIYIVTDFRPSTIKSNPFIEVNFRLFSRDQEKLKQLNRQVHEEYITALSAIGTSKSLVITKLAQESILDHLNSYLEILYLYAMLFYDKNKAAFVFNGLDGPKHERRSYVDMTLWKFMFDEGIVIFDDLVTYANNNLTKNIDRIYTSCPDVYIDEYAFRRSIIWRIYDKDGTPSVRKSRFDEYRYPHIWEPTSRITKYQGQDIWYLEEYDNHPSTNDEYGDFYIWDDEFLCRIRNNDPYPEKDDLSADSVCSMCVHQCNGSPVLCFNPYLRNVIINWFNGNDIDWSNIQISDIRTIENYYLIPMVLGIYKKYIQGLA